MYNYFQEGGEDPTGAGFFNGLIDMATQQPEQDVVDVPVVDEEDLPNDFINGLSQYATETENTDLQTQIDELRQQLAMRSVENDLDAQEASLQEQLALAEFYQTPDGEDALLSKYEPTTAATPTADGPKYSVGDVIAKRESGGNYQAFTSAGGGSGAVGKYQFRWNLHKDWISKLTGVHSAEEFKKSPTAQEKAFAYWEQTTLTPAAIAIQKELAGKNKQVPSIDEIKQKVHFAGAAGARNYYLHGKETTDAFGTKTSTYKMGGKKYKC